MEELLVSKYKLSGEKLYHHLPYNYSLGTLAATVPLMKRMNVS